MWREPRSSPAVGTVHARRSMPLPATSYEVVAKVGLITGEPMKLTCSKCNEAPRASVKSHRCAACEREYNVAHGEARRAAKRRWFNKNKELLAQAREDRVAWWTNHSAEALQNIKALYRQSQRDLPREYHVAMRRLEQRRRRAQLAHLNSLPPKLARAAIRWQKACLRGSRPEDCVREREWA